MKKKKRFLTGDERSLLRRILRIMKLTTFILLATTMMVSASLYSQSTKVSLKFSEISYLELFQEIENQTEFRFAFSSSKLDPNQKVEIDVRKKTLEEILDKTLPKEVAYEIIDRYVVILNASEKRSVVVSQQQNVVSGKVTDSSGAPLPGVTVVIKGTTQGTMTNSDGEYNLSNIAVDAVLQFSFVGMRTQEVMVGSQTSINVTMEEDAIGIEEVVAVGYGTQKKINLTGSVDVVSSKALANRPPANVGALLQGVSPNLNISVSSYGGEPGADMNFNIRGTGTLSGSNSPLILVDGVELNIGNIDPETIENVSILKDAAASAIYGSRAPFGVVLITTKKGTKNKGVSISYSNNIAFSSPTNLPEWQSSIRYVTAYNQALQNSGLPDKFKAPQIDRINRYLEGTYTPEYDTINPPSRTWGGRHEGNANYDYFDVFYKDVSVNQKHNVSISGGDDKNQFYVSSGYYDQGSSYTFVEENYERYNVSANFNSQPNKWLHLNVNTKYALEKQTHPNYFQDDSRRYLMREFIGMYPITPMYNVNGTINNPIASPMIQGGAARRNENDLVIILGTELEPIKGWKTNINYSYNYIDNKYTYLDSEVWIEIPNGELINEMNNPNQFRQHWTSDSYQLFNTTTSYEKTVKGHFLKAMLGYEREYRYYSNLGGFRKNLITEDVPSITTATGDFNIYDGMGHWATEAFFGRLNYNYKEKYLVEIVGRSNGSSKFAKGSRWGFFPSVSAGYNIAKEPFWEPMTHYINNFKLRGSYGSLGNQNVDNYLYLSNIPISSNLEAVIDNKRPLYSSIPGIKSPTLTWETVTVLDIGTDIDLFNNRLGFAFDWYERNTSDMFGPAEILPATLGANPPQENNASIVTRGWELSLTWRDRINNDLNYSARFMLADSRSHVTKYLNTAGLIDEWYVGKEVGEIWGYTTVGLIQTAEEAASMADQSYFYNEWGPGDVRYADLNGDSKIDDGNRTLDDHGDLSIIGNTSPRYTMGFTGTVNWKNFDFSMFWNGVLKRDLPSESYYGSVIPWGVGTRGNSGGVLFQDEMDNYWRPANETNLFGPNTDGFLPKPYVTEETFKNQKVQSRYLRSTAYLNLSNVQLGYTIPKKLTDKIRVQNLKLYVSGENLITFDKVPEYMNPISANVGVGDIYPLSRSVSFGLNVTF